MFVNGQEDVCICANVWLVVSLQVVPCSKRYVHDWTVRLGAFLFNVTLPSLGEFAVVLCRESIRDVKWYASIAPLLICILSMYCRNVHLRTLRRKLAVEIHRHTTTLESHAHL